MPASARQTRMLFENCRIAHRIQVCVDDRGSIQHYDYRSVLSGNFLTVPFTGWLLKPLPGGDHVVDRTVILRGAQLALITGSAVVQYLDFHAFVGGVPFQGRTDPDAIVGAL